MTIWTHFQDYTGTDEDSSPFTENNTHGITVVHHTHMFQLEVDHDPTCQVSESSQTDGGDDTTDDTQSLKDRWEGQKTKCDTLESASTSYCN